MERFNFKTRFKKGHKWEIDKIVKLIPGGVSNLVELGTTPYGNTVLRIQCTEEQYMTFTKSVERLYPGLCDFDI